MTTTSSRMVEKDLRPELVTTMVFSMPTTPLPGKITLG